MAELAFALIDAASFERIPVPARAGARCQTCDYWERLDGTREREDSATQREVKLARLLAGEQLAGAYGMLATRTNASGDEIAVGWAQFGPISAYPRAQVIRDRYPDLPDSPAPWVITCLQVVGSELDRAEVGAALLDAVCGELDRRGIGAVEAYPEGVADPWIPSPGPAQIYRDSGFAHVAGEERYPVFRRELGGSGGDVDWGDLLFHARPADEGDEWPLPLPKGPTEDDLFRLPEKPKRPNPFGED